MKTKSAAKFTMRIGSLIDSDPNSYIGIYDKNGYLIGHEYGNQKSEIPMEETAQEVEVKNQNQLQLF